MEMDKLYKSRPHLPTPYSEPVGQLPADHWIHLKCDERASETLIMLGLEGLSRSQYKGKLRLRSHRGSPWATRLSVHAPLHPRTDNSRGGRSVAWGFGFQREEGGTGSAGWVWWPGRGQSKPGDHSKSCLKGLLSTTQPVSIVWPARRGCGPRQDQEVGRLALGPFWGCHFSHMVPPPLPIPNSQSPPELTLTPQVALHPPPWSLSLISPTASAPKVPFSHIM